MKINKILIIVIMISSVGILFGCSNSNSKEISSKENNETKNETVLEDNSTQSKSNEESDSTKTKANIETKFNNIKSDTETNSDEKETNAKTNKVAEDNSLTFKSKLGFLIKFPSNWKDKYTIKEDNNSMHVYFKSTDPNTPKNSGLLFVIMKKNDSLNENMFDSIDGKKYITVGNTTYFIGGPTDIGLDPENKDFNIFASINKERNKVIDTITSLN